MELKTYFRPLIKWWWLLVIATVVAMLSSYLVTMRQPPVFQSRTTLVMGRAVYETNPSGNELYLNQQLAAFYTDIAQREPVRTATMEKLGLTFLPEYVVNNPTDSQIIEIIVSDTDAARAQAVANELANQLINRTPTSGDNAERLAFIEEQLNQLEIKITETQAEITKKQTELGDLFSARQISDARNEINGLEEKLSTLRSNYATLLSNTEKGATNRLSVIEAANLPRQPIGPNRLMLVLLSGAIAFVVACAAAYLLEYLDDTLKSPEEVTRLLNMPVIGYISDLEKGVNMRSYVVDQPRSAIAEAFRALRTDLEFSNVDRPLKTIFVSSAGVGTGKSTIAATLAIIMAQGGKKVILLDADLRKPSVHQVMDIPNTKGLTDVFRGNMDIYNASVNWNEGNLFVIPSGAVPPNPSELLNSKKMDQILDNLERLADVVIIDGPPFVVTDATILSAKVDGVLLVVRYGFTRRQEALSVLHQLQRSEAKVLGVVMNRIPRKGVDYYNIFRYYQSYYYHEEEDQYLETSNGKPKAKNILKRKPKTVLKGEEID